MPLSFSRKSSRASSTPISPLEENSDDDIKMVNTLSDDYQEIEYSAKRARAAARATEAEHKMTIRYPCKRYPKLVFWCLVFNFIATGVEFCKYLNLKTRVPKEFQREFGWKPYYRLPLPAGELAGIFAGSMFADKIGRRLSTALGIFITTLGILLESGAQHGPFILGAMVVLGIGLGILRLNAVVYCSEISPVSFRGVAVAGIPLNAISGAMLANMITHAFIRLNDSSPWSFRIPFLLQLIFVIIVSAVLPFVPESPWWLARKYYKIDNARKSLNRIYGKYEDVSNLTASLEKTVERENNMGVGCPYIAIFNTKYKHVRRTFIILGAFMCSSGLVGYGFIQRIMVYPFPAHTTSSGKTNNNNEEEENDAFRDISISLACSYFGSLLCLILISTLGRRRSFLIGGCLLPLLLLGFAILQSPSSSSSSSSQYGSNSKQNLPRFIFGCVYLFIHSATIRGASYVLIADISSPIFRSASTCLALMLDTILTTVLDYLAPNIIDGMDGVGNSCYIFIGCGVLGIIWAFFMVPELKRRTFEEVSELFEDDRVSARRMRDYST